METVTQFPIELDGFKPIRKLGSGGFGQVWLAHQPALDRMVALKVGHKPLDSQDEKLRFERECKALGRLSSSDHIIDIYFTGIADNGVPYLVLEYIDGGSLAEQKNLSEERLRQITIQLCEAIKNVHHSDVLHRDLKPANVFLRKNGTVVVGDFGVARLGDVEETSTNQIVASLAYAAPEILHGHPPTQRSDVYGIAITILTAALGYSPFKSGNSNATMYAVLHHEPAMPAALSKEFQTLLQQALSKDAAQRPASANDLQQRTAALPNTEEASNIFLAVEGLSEPEPSTVVAPTQSQFSKMFLAGSAAFIVLAVVAIGFFYFLRNDAAASAKEQLKTQTVSVVTENNQPDVDPPARETSLVTLQQDQQPTTTSSLTEPSQDEPSSSEQSTSTAPTTQAQPPSTTSAITTTTAAVLPSPLLSSEQQKTVAQLAGLNTVKPGKQIIFENGASQKAVDGSVTPIQRDLYTFEARKDQVMELTLISDNSGSYFTVINPDGKVLSSFDGTIADETSYFLGDLPSTGNYAILITPILDESSFQAILQLS